MNLPKHVTKKIALALFVVLMASFHCNAIAWADMRNPDAAAMIADTLIARPLGLASMVIGSAMFVVALPFSAPSGNLETVAGKMVVEPTLFTFRRPLGKM